MIPNRKCRQTERKSCYTLKLYINWYDSTEYHAQSMYKLRNGPWPSYAQLDGTEPEFEVQRARRVAMPREKARLIAVSVKDLERQHVTVIMIQYIRMILAQEDDSLRGT
jgi:hypothetical protein